MKAVVAYQKKLNSATNVPRPVKLDQEMEKKRKSIVRSFSIARIIYKGGRDMHLSKESELEVGAEFLEVWFLISFKFSIKWLSSVPLLFETYCTLLSCYVLFAYSRTQL